jgi:hypothetical protein
LPKERFGFFLYAGLKIEVKSSYLTPFVSDISPIKRIAAQPGLSISAVKYIPAKAAGLNINREPLDKSRG